VGTTTITATLGAVSGSATLTVTTATLTSITVSPANPTIALGLSQQFTATGTYSDNSTQPLGASDGLSWSSSDAVAAIDADTGLATTGPGGVGTTTITATLGAVSGTATLTVTAATLTSITVSPANPAIALGSSQQFTATGTYSDNSQQNLTAQVSWTSSAGAAAIDAGGLATAQAVGTTTITASLDGVSGSTELTVTAAPLVISTTTLPVGRVDETYSATLSATGGTEPYRWSVTSGALPVGLSLNSSTGAITGTPTRKENVKFTVQVTDSANPAATASGSFGINVRK